VWSYNVIVRITPFSQTAAILDPPCGTSIFSLKPQNYTKQKAIEINKGQKIVPKIEKKYRKKVFCNFQILKITRPVAMWRPWYRQI